MSYLNRRRYTILAAFLLVVGALLLVASIASFKGKYREPTPREIAAFLVSLFAISLLVERTVAVGFALFRWPKDVELKERAVIEASDVESSYEPAGDPKAKSAGATQEGVAEEAALALVIYRAFSDQYSVAAATILGLLLAIAGISTLSTFVYPPTPDSNASFEYQLYHVMDALLTAGSIGGGSRAVQAMATSLLAFVALVPRRPPKLPHPWPPQIPPP